MEPGERRAWAMTYAVVLTDRARKQLLELPKKIQAAIAQAIDDLSDGLNHHCKKLAGSNGSYRLRVGNYRIIFQIERAELVVMVIKIAHRRDVYRAL